MSTIEIILSTDSPSTSLGDINANFAALNADKIEADSADTLENKIIDVDDNTVSNIEVDNIKTTSKTGVDSKLVTGTVGDANEIAIWNSDGDLVSSDKTFSTEIAATDDDTEIPTSKAVVDYINTKVVSKELFVRASRHSVDTNPYSTAVGDFAVIQQDSGEDSYFVFHVPSDFTTLTSIHFIMIPDATETITFDVDTDISGHGEAYNNHSGTASNVSYNATSGLMTYVRIDNASGTPFSSMMAEDMVAVFINSDLTMIRPIGLLIKYT